MILLRIIRFLFPKPKPKKKEVELISLLVPFKDDNGTRSQLWNWLKEYWECELPDAEIIIGHDPGSHGKRNKHVPFSKSKAVNNAFHRSKGDIIVILDADAYLPGTVIQHCADRIRAARKRNVRTWFVPYRTIYRLTQAATARLLNGDPCNPERFPSPPALEDIESLEGTSFGHRYGALIQIMPREAFQLVGGMDPRFRGWGGEDVCFLRALDTLWAKHKNLPNDVLHLWHPNYFIGSAASWKTRVWLGQTSANANERLSNRYDKASYKPVQMRMILDEIKRKHHRK